MKNPFRNLYIDEPEDVEFDDDVMVEENDMTEKIGIKCNIPNNETLEEIRKKRDAEEMTKMANGLSYDDARTICDVIVKKYPSVIFAALETEFTTNRQFIDRMKDMVQGE